MTISLLSKKITYKYQMWKIMREMNLKNMADCQLNGKAHANYMVRTEGPGFLFYVSETHTRPALIAYARIPLFLHRIRGHTFG